jgi:hypothetical protein
MSLINHKFVPIYIGHLTGWARHFDVVDFGSDNGYWNLDLRDWHDWWTSNPDPANWYIYDPGTGGGIINFQKPGGKNYSFTAASGNSGWGDPFIGGYIQARTIGTSYNWVSGQYQADGYPSWYAPSAVVADSYRLKTENSPGVCGLANGGTYLDLVEVANAGFCSVGEVETDDDNEGYPKKVDGIFEWTCLGVCGGEPASCTANEASFPGACGDAVNEEFDSIEKARNSDNDELCSVGTVPLVDVDSSWKTDMKPDITQNGDEYSWICQGINGGDDTFCSTGEDDGGGGDSFSVTCIDSDEDNRVSPGETITYTTDVPNDPDDYNYEWYVDGAEYDDDDEDGSIEVSFNSLGEHSVSVTVEDKDTNETDTDACETIIIGEPIDPPQDLDLGIQQPLTENNCILYWNAGENAICTINGDPVTSMSSSYSVEPNLYTLRCTYEGDYPAQMDSERCVENPNIIEE